MKKIKYFFIEKFEFSMAEAQGAMAFLFLLSISVIVLSLLKMAYQPKPLYINISKIEAVGFEDTNQRRTDEVFPNKKCQSFEFNPNLATKEQFMALGIHPRTAQTIINYRNKGGKFKRKEDFSRIYGLKSDTYERLAPLIYIPKTESQAINIKKYTDDDTKLEAGKKYTSSKKNVFIEDLNTADTSQLIAINGIGKVLASRIIKYRDALGGFTSKTQINEVYGINPEVASWLIQQSAIKSSAKKIHINTSNYIRHPYLKAHQARAIVAYRKTHGGINNIDDLKHITIIDEQTIQKLAPYLSY